MEGWKGGKLEELDNELIRQLEEWKFRLNRKPNLSEENLKIRKNKWVRIKNVTIQKSMGFLLTT